MKFIEKSGPTQKCEIYVAGSLPKLEAVATKFVKLGLCVRVTPSDFIFTEGRESGATITLINYPRFSRSSEYIRQLAIALGHRILEETDQLSLTVLSTGAINDTVYIAKREKDAGKGVVTS